MADYVGLGSEVTITKDGPKTVITIDNKRYPAEKINDMLESVNKDIEEIKNKLASLDENHKQQISEIIEKYNETSNPTSKLQLLHTLIDIGSGIASISVNILDIKTKLGL